METVFVRTESGVVYQMDIDSLDDEGQPTTQLRERFDERVARGELTIIDGECVQVENFDKSGYHWVEVGADDKPARGRKPKPEPEGE